MKFKATYIHREGTKENYYRTLFTDSLNEAMKTASRWTRKGYTCIRVVQDFTGVY